MKTNLPVRFQIPTVNAELDGVIFTVSRDHGKNRFGFREYRFKGECDSEKENIFCNMPFAFCGMYFFGLPQG